MDHSIKDEKPIEERHFEFECPFCHVDMDLFGDEALPTKCPSCHRVLPESNP